MGQCIRGKMADIGLFPKPAETEVAEVETPATPSATPEATSEPEEQLTAPALDVKPAEDASAAPGGIVAATFGLLRAEPDGSVVIAGSGTPGSEVDVYSDETLLGSATVESTGDWVFVPETPLAAGGVEITLAERGKEGRAAQSFVVVVNEDKTTQPLVVASVPGQASEILQGLDRTAAAPTTQTAAIEPADTQPATPPAAVPPADQAPTPAEAASATVAEAPAATPVPAIPPVTPAATPPAPAAPGIIAATPAAPTPAEPVASAPASPAVAAPAPETAAAPETEVATAAEPATPTPAAAETPAVPAAQLADTAPSIDAIEIEGDRTFFAGAGPDGGIVRLYVDDEFVADSTIEGGRWLIEGGAVLDAPTQRVRADLLAQNSSEVIARAEVDFVVDMPAEATPPEAPTAVASANTPAAPAATTEPVTPAPAPTPTPAVEPAPAATPAAPAVVEAPAAPVETAVAETPAPQPVAEPSVPTMVAVSVGGPDAQRFASGKAIIRRGDNLWTIARRVYGEGIKYTTIYDANTGQIRDPDRIYPGQVFSLPN